jgi:hypothetical protein
MQGYFLSYLFRAVNTSSVIFLGLSDPFFLERMRLSGVAFKAAKTLLIVALSQPSFLVIFLVTTQLLSRPE